MSLHNRTHDDVDQVLDFWFGEMVDGFAAPATRRRWFAADPAFDRQITERFGNTLVDAARGRLTHWLAGARGRLAFIVVTDQFSRQIHRGTASAFATDELSRSAARDGVDRGLDRMLSIDQRSIFYLPFEHSESADDQRLSVALFTQLLAETPDSHRTAIDESLRYAHAHHDIVVRFGRFPHRNAVLGRASTDAELEFLRTASRFGQ